MQNAERRILWIDALRVVAIVCILVNHTLYEFLDKCSYTRLLMVSGSAFLFVLASGYLVLPVPSPGWQWLKHKFARVGIPTLIWGTLYIVLFNIDNPLGDYREPVWRQCINFVFNERGSMWFMNMFLGLCLVAPIFSPWLQQASKRQVQWALALWLAAGSYTIWDANFGWGWSPQNTIIGGFYGYFGYMVMGYYLRRWPLQQQSKRHNALFCGGLLLISVVCWTRFSPMMRDGVGDVLDNDLSVNNMAWFTLIFAAFSLIRRLPDWLEKATHFLARSVFGAYLAMDLSINYISIPLFGDNPWLAVPASIVAAFTIGTALRHIPKVGKYLC